MSQKPVLPPLTNSATAGTTSILSLSAPPAVQQRQQQVQQSARKGDWAKVRRPLESALQQYGRDPRA